MARIVSRHGPDAQNDEVLRINRRRPRRRTSATGASDGETTPLRVPEDGEPALAFGEAADQVALVRVQLASATTGVTLRLTPTYYEPFLKGSVDVFGSIVATALEEYCDTRRRAGYDCNEIVLIELE